jgi:hypothetical protein
MEGASLSRDFEGFFFHAYLVSFFFDPEDVANLSIRVTCNFGKGTGLL